MNGNGCGQSAFMWAVRSLPAVSQAFAAAWNVDPDGLLVSFDGACIFRPWHERREWRTKAMPFHVDQNAWRPDRSGFVCVQGMCTLTEANEATGGLVVVPRSHAAHGEICAGLPHAREWADYVPVPEHDSALQAADKGGARMLRLPAGSLVVWDSRTVHCNAPALGSPALPQRGAGGLLRAACYVSMAPAAGLPEALLEQRRHAVAARLSSTHWVRTFVPAGGAPPGPPLDPSSLTPVQRRLAGFR